ncbi:claudin-10 [Clupea harengus]|uniref:Claudin-10 n=1 Tax=Clupea harengus TaxID=7950 RepID=A0A6P3VT81_CLUHA|nr:claudin-10 [Clupea harengus]
MKYRTVIMYMEIGCFVICVCGWILVCSTMPTEYWTFSEVASIVLTTSNYFSNLWKDCISDSTGVSDCKGFPSMLALQMYIHLCRALIITSIILGFFGAILALVGMKCTKIGGTEIINARVTFAAGMNYLVSGLCSMFAFSWYGSKVVAEFKNPNYKAQKFELGAGLFIGWGGSTLLICGGLVYSIFAGMEGCRSSPENTDVPVYTTYRAPPSYTSSSAKRTYSLPPSSIPGRESRKSRASSRISGRTYSTDPYV